MSTFEPPFSDNAPSAKPEGVSYVVSFVLADLTVAFKGCSQKQAELLDGLLEQFFHLKPARALSKADITVFFDESSSLARLTNEVLLYETNILKVSKTDKGFYLRCADAWLDLNPSENRGEGRLPESFWSLNAYDQREFFLLSLLMLLRPHGLYGLHANGLATGERGLLIVGPSGSGKTTLTLSLLQQGWKFLSDDAVLLKDAEPLYAYAFRRGFSFTLQTESFFDTHKTEAMYSAQDKRVLDAQRLYPEQFTPYLRPRLMVFPEISARPKSEFVKLSSGEALITLVEQSAGSMVDRGAAAKQLELLKRLVQSTSCYRLVAGKDVIEHGSSVSAKLETLLDVSYG